MQVNFFTAIEAYETYHQYEYPNNRPNGGNGFRGNKNKNKNRKKFGGGGGGGGGKQGGGGYYPEDPEYYPEYDVDDLPPALERIGDCKSTLLYPVV